MVHVRVPAANYIVVGDSSAHAFDGIVVEHPNGLAVLKARWHPMFRVADIYGDGKLSEYLTRVLMEMRFVKQTADTHWPFPALRENMDGTGMEFHFKPRNAHKCVLLFACGETDLFQLTSRGTVDQSDEEAAFNAVRASFEPLFLAIRALRSIGYDNVFLRGITPPTKRDVPWGPYALRLKLAEFGRELFQRFADETGTGLISTWDDIFSAEEGRHRRYIRDHLHLNVAAAELAAQRLCDLLERRGFYETSGAESEYPECEAPPPEVAKTAAW